MEQDEWLDLVDEHDVVVDRRLRSEVYAQKLPYFRAVNLFIRNSKNKLWIPRRTAHKKQFPLALDYSCAGHVESGHTYDQTLKKEAMEELNIDTDAYDVKVLGKCGPQEGFWFFVMCYEIRSDEVPQYNKEDFFESFWLTPEELQVRIQGGDAAKGSLLPVVQKFYLSAKNVA